MPGWHCVCALPVPGVMAKAQPCMCPDQGCALGHGTSSSWAAWLAPLHPLHHLPAHLQHVQREGWDLGAAGMRKWEQSEQVWCLC